jgi:hypothetical protein
MGWAVGYDTNWHRDVGYGVPAKCDHPDCNADIDRGLGYVCGGEPYGGEWGCGLFFCDEHLGYTMLAGAEMSPQQCDRCAENAPPFEPKPDLEIWTIHKLNDASWQRWRDENPAEVTRLAGLS